MRPVLVALLLAPALAGCLAPPATDLDPGTAVEAAPRGLAEIVPFEARAGDGAALRGHVYLPDGEGPFAVVLDYGPYWNSGYGPSGAQQRTIDGRVTMTNLTRPFLEAGFAVALVNVRGTGISDGCVQYGGPVDWSDAYAVVEGLAAEPWSSGSVGMYGISYDGKAQYMAMAAQPPSLKAVIPMSAVSDHWNLLTVRGAGQGYMPMHRYVAYHSLNLAEAMGLRVPPVEPTHLGCPRYPDDFRANAEIVWNGDKNAWLEERDYLDEIAASDVPALVTNGLTNGEGHILQVEGLWDRLPAGSRLVLGQWPHAVPQRDDWAATAVAWMDHHLRDAPLPTAPPVEYQDDGGDWHEASRWPPPAAIATLHLDDGALVADANRAAPSERVVLSQSVFDPHPSVCGPHVALWASPPLAEDVLLAGNYRVHLTLASNLPDGNLGAYLYATSGSGACGDDAAREIRRAITDLRHAEDPKGRDFPTGTATPVTLVSHPFATVVQAGERLVLAFGSPGADTFPDTHLPRLTVTTGPGLAGSVEVPVVAGTLRLADAPGGGGARDAAELLPGAS